MQVEGLAISLFLSVSNRAKRFDEIKTSVFLSFRLGEIDVLDRFRFVAKPVRGEARFFFCALFIIMTPVIESNRYNND